MLGYAHRPVNKDQWNTLFKYTYFFNLPAPEQQIAAGSSADFIQRSHIRSADMIYELTDRWSIGGKYAYRLGELANGRPDPEFFQSRAELLVLRADWHMLRRWDILIEVRRLDLVDAGDGIPAAGPCWASIATSGTTSSLAWATTSPTSRTT